jgi:hypothetical protein
MYDVVSDRLTTASYLRYSPFVRGGAPPIRTLRWAPMGDADSSGHRAVSPPQHRRGDLVRHNGPFRSVDDLALATLSWVHWFSTARLHSPLTTSPNRV